MKKLQSSPAPDVRLKNPTPSEPLTAGRLDALGALSFAGRSTDGRTFTTAELGAYLEWAWLRAAGNELGTLSRTAPFDELHRRMCSGSDRWMIRSAPARGFIRVRRDHTDIENDAWTQFRFELQRAATDGGFSSSWARQIVGAVGELEDNIHCHSEDPTSGILAYWLADASLEIVVLDRGIGVLGSLRQAEEFTRLSDHGTALRIALQEGKSRYGSDSGRGWGFHELFVGLANSNARLRFRSGDHLLTMERTTDLPEAELRQSAAGTGFLISVRVPALRP